MKKTYLCQGGGRWLAALGGLIFAHASLLAQQNVGFVEEFALAKDRAEALKQLIPGTEDYYYYHSLHFQNERNVKELDRILQEWENRFKNSGRRKRIQNREFLIRYSDDPKKTLAHLKREMKLQLDHQQEGKAREAKHPSALDQELVSWDAFLKDALARSGTLQNLQGSAFFPYLKTKPKLSSSELRDLLARASTPDLPGLLELIAADLKSKESKGFGEFKIHRVLTKVQLEKLLSKIEKLTNNQSFVETYLSRLLPGADESMAVSSTVREAYLERAENFVSSLPASFNSLKAHILYQRLSHDRALGRENEARFLKYLGLPRNVSYLNPEWRDKDPALWKHPAELGKDYRGVTSLPPIGGGDLDLVKAYLLKFLKDDKDSSTFAPYLRESWLRRIFAEAKITNGVGRPSDWAALLSPSEFQELKDRVDIQFDPTNLETFSINDGVSLKLHLKNVQKLIVKVFEINTLNYYRNLGNEVSTDIDLDGLVANFNEIHEYQTAPQLKKEQVFKLAAIPNRRGLWVVEFIGGGKSSRAVIRKGSLGILNRTLPQGELVTVLDEKYQPLGTAGVWVGGEFYNCDKDGRVLLPFSNNPGTRDVVVQDSSGYATLAKLVQPAESYALSAGMHLARESLRTGGKAKLIMRPTLTVAGQTISFTQIKSASLELVSTDLDNLPASMSIPNLELLSDREFVHEFRVPDRLVKLTAALRVKVKVASQGGKVVELTDSRSFRVNEILRGEAVGDLYLSKIDGRYRVEFLGHNAEPLGRENLNVIFRHRHFKNQRNTTLKTNAAGSVDLGTLAGVSNLMVKAPGGQTRSWTLRGDRRDHNGMVAIAAGETLKIPYVGKLDREAVAIFSRQSRGFVSDEFARLKLVNGYLTAKLPAGDYQLLLKSAGHRIDVSVAAGDVSQGYVFNDTRMLELPVRPPSHLQSVRVDAKALEIQVAGLDQLTRVHVIGTRFLPGYDPFAALGGSQRPGLRTVQARFLPNLYISGRKLGDELRYVLERRYAEKFVGNMLTRPEILLNPWAVRDTESGSELLQAGDRFARKPVPKSKPTAGRDWESRNANDKQDGEVKGSSSYEFLANNPVVLANLAPGKDGRISISLDAFGDRQHVHVLLLDPEGATYRSISLSDAKTQTRDLRLTTNALDPKRHFTEQEQVTMLKDGDSVKIPDLLNSEFEVYDHLGSVYRYFLTLKNDSTLREFSFVTKWPGLSAEEKKAKYSEFACHELSFFLSKKDPIFFKEVVVPHLRNKKDRTFMDDHLLGNALDKYYEAFEYSRLNVVERILLAQVDVKRLAAFGLDLENRLALTPPDTTLERRFFGAALGTGGFGDGYAGKKILAVSGLISDEKGRGIRSLGEDSFGDPGAPAVEAKKLSRMKRQIEAEAEVMDRLEKKSNKVDGGVDAFYFDLAEATQAPLRQLYRALDPTKEWAENNYYKIPQKKQNYQLVDENRFWLDLVRHGVKPGFGSRHLGEVTGNFTEMMLALAVLDLPFNAPKHREKIEKDTLDFTAGGNALFFHREVKEAGMAGKRSPLLVSQSYFQISDRFRMEDGRKVYKFITEEFVRGVVYGAQVVVTNPTSSRQRLDVLTQIPKGSVAIRGRRSTTTRPIQLEPYSTHRLEIAFYFPRSGKFSVYPAHVSKTGEVVAHSDGLIFNVVDQPTTADQSSWAWISQWGEEGDVLQYLQSGNLHAIDLTKIAWRCRESGEFFKKTIATLNLRGIYHPIIQGYAVAHDHKDAIAQLLLMEGRFLDQCGVALECDLITVDPVNRRRYEHLEYKPLVNNRAHALGGQNRILNPVVRGQYSQFLTVLSQQKSLNDLDRLGVAYYLFLQDRVSEALEHLGKVNRAKLETKMQLDYFQAYAAFYEEDLAKARQLAAKYRNYPVDRWRERFADLSAQIKEIAGAGPRVINEGDRNQEQQLAASRETAIDLKIKGNKAMLDHQNIEDVTVNYYEMDLEFLFSTNPFVSRGTSRFAIIQPNKSVPMRLGGDKGVKTFPLPAEYQASNVIVEVIGGGKKVSQAVYANDLKTILSESMGLLTVRHGITGKPLSKVYVKVYADTANGVKFFKDGYTDLRGKFDYASVSSTGLGQVRKFGVLVMSEENGATVIEAGAPQR